MKRIEGVPQPKGKKVKKPSIAKLKKKLWITFSAYIKLRDRNICFTCGEVAFGSGMHAGHFIPKAAGGLALYFNEDNVHAQCLRCNLYLGGRQYEYGIKLGQELVDKLYKLKNEDWKWGAYEYEQKIDEYRSRVEKLNS